MNPVNTATRPSTGRILARSAVVAAVLAGCLTMVAQPATTVLGFWWGHAYVWANNATSTIGVPYTPSLSYQFSSTSAQNTVTRLAIR